ncbi:hypothetical protein DFQ30_004642, partial [Apophysomyces sp. BC1015]
SFLTPMVGYDTLCSVPSSMILRTCVYSDGPTDDTNSNRPDGTITLREQYHVAYALGFCGAKAHDTKRDKGKQHRDLLRLAIFSQNAINRLEIQAIVAIQSI